MINKEHVFNGFENVIRKYYDFKIFIINISEIYSNMKKLSNDLSESVNSMNEKNTFHTDLSKENSKNIEKMYVLKKQITIDNNELVKHLSYCNHFLKRVKKDIDQIKNSLDIKENGSIEKLLKFLEELFNKKKYKDDLDSSENYEVLKKLDERIMYLNDEIDKHCHILKIKYNKYISSIFNIEGDTNNQYDFNVNEQNLINSKNYKQSIVIDSKKYGTRNFMNTSTNKQSIENINKSRKSIKKSPLNISFDKSKEKNKSQRIKSNIFNKISINKQYKRFNSVNEKDSTKNTINFNKFDKKL